MIFDTKVDIFNTPRMRYYKLQGEFRKIYLNPRAWNHEFGSRQSVQAYHDLLYYLEMTEQFREQCEVLSTAIPTDNIHLVLRDLPLPLQLREMLGDYIVANRDRTVSEQSKEEKLRKIKEYFEMKKSIGLDCLEDRCEEDARNVDVEKATKYDKKKSNEVKKNKRKGNLRNTSKSLFKT